MFAFFAGASLRIARNLIQVTGLKESLAVFQKNNFSNISEVEVLKLLLAVDACNLLQTMKEDFISREISEEDRQDAVDDYVVENLKGSAVIPCRDGAERMEQLDEILGVAAKFQENWTREDTKDPGPRFYCVKELLRRLNCEDNTPIHDNLFEFVYQQHNRFIRYFKTLLEPFRTEGVPEPVPEQPLAVVMHVPAAETVHPSSSLETAYTRDEKPEEEEGPSPVLSILPKSGPGEPETPPEAEAGGEDEGDKSSEPLSRARESEDGEEPRGPQPAKIPAFRPLDMMDPLSGFPNPRPRTVEKMEVEKAPEIPLEENIRESFTWEAFRENHTEGNRGPEAAPLAGPPPGSGLEPGNPGASLPQPMPPAAAQDPPAEKPASPDRIPETAYRPLDLQDPLSGFPNLPPLEEKAPIEKQAAEPLPAKDQEPFPGGASREIHPEVVEGLTLPRFEEDGLEKAQETLSHEPSRDSLFPSPGQELPMEKETVEEWGGKTEGEDPKREPGGQETFAPHPGSAPITEKKIDGDHPLLPATNLREVDLDSGEFPQMENMSLEEDEKPASLEDLSPGPSVMFPQPTPQMLEELFRKVNPVDPREQKGN